eukprot:792461-Rhodomonas_salina.1
MRSRGVSEMRSRGVPEMRSRTLSSPSATRTWYPHTQSQYRPLLGSAGHCTAGVRQDAGHCVGRA